MIEINPSRFKTPAPLKHQLDGIRALVKNQAFALFDDPRTMKSRQVIDAACFLNEAGVINAVVIVAPAQVRAVWADASLGEIREWAWRPAQVREFALGKYEEIWSDKDSKLLFVVTNYEILRNHHERFIETLKGLKVMLVLDESDLVKNRTSQQSKAVAKLRESCERCVLLTATPGTVLDQWSQFQILDKSILGKTFNNNYYLFRNKYCEMRPDFARGRRFMKVQSFRNIEDFGKRTAPYVLHRKKEDVLDLPPRVFSIVEVPLKKESWHRYKELKRDAVIALSNGDIHLEPNAAVRIMRLSQLCGGILGGMAAEHENQEMNDSMGFVQDLSSEKLDWCVEYLNKSTTQGTIVWCRFRRERERLAEALKDLRLNIYQIYGGQKKDEREKAKKVFHVRAKKLSTRSVIIGQPGAGGVGLDMAQASEVIRMSSDYSLRTLVQSDDRPYGPGQTKSVFYTDVLATGPNGEPSIDHLIVKAIREKVEIAQWTASHWRKVLNDE